jgi:hypothetical protein
MARRPDAVDLQSQGSVTPDDRRVCPAEDDLLAWVHRWHARVCSLPVWLLAAGADHNRIYRAAALSSAGDGTKRLPPRAWKRR